MSFYNPYDLYDVIDALNQRRALELEQQQRQRRFQGNSRSQQPQSAYYPLEQLYSAGVPQRAGYQRRPQPQQPSYFPRVNPLAAPGFVYRQPNYYEDDGDKVYTLDDILNLVSRQTDKKKKEQEQEDYLAKEKAAEVGEEAAATAAAVNKEKEQEDEEMKAIDQESSSQQPFDIIDLIRQALLAGDEDEEEVVQTEKSRESSKSPETKPSSIAPKKPETSKIADTSKENKVPSFHFSAPSPVHDPLQVSQPQVDSNLPFSPHVDIYDKPELYKVVLSLPGANKNSFEIDFHPSNHELFIRGSTSNRDKLVSKDSDEDLKYLKVSEINFGSFERSIKFPIFPKVKDEEIKAKYSNGLLEISIPKLTLEKEEVKPKKRVTVEEVEDEELKFEDGLKKL